MLAQRLSDGVRGLRFPCFFVHLHYNLICSQAVHITLLFPNQLFDFFYSFELRAYLTVLYRRIRKVLIPSLVPIPGLAIADVCLCGKKINKYKDLNHLYFVGQPLAKISSTTLIGITPTQKLPVFVRRLEGRGWELNDAGKRIPMITASVTLHHDTSTITRPGIGTHKGTRT